MSTGLAPTVSEEVSVTGAVRVERVSEPDRVAALRASGVLVTRPQKALDALARAAAVLCGVRVGLVNFLDDTTTNPVATTGIDIAPGSVFDRSRSACTYTIAAQSASTVIGDLALDGRPACAPSVNAGYRFYAGAKVRAADDTVLGTVCVLGQVPGALTPAQLQALEDLAAIASTLVDQYAQARQLVGVADRLGREADTDPLTGLYNRRALEPVLTNLPARTAVAMVDLDHFKALNDREGHDGGDRALTGYADLFRSTLRTGDLAARWGGEEFLLVLHDARDPAEVLRRVQRRARAGQPVTFSAGLTLACPGEDPMGMLDRVDRLLYTAKRTGRDRVVDDLAR